MPFKVCTFDCPYCQVGATVTRTLQRGEYVPVSDVLAEFDDWLSHGGQADCLTLAGAGEPTLHSRFGEVLCEIRRRCSIRKVLLSNGSLFHDPAVRASAVHAEVVKATLGAWDQESFEQVHHPCSGLSFDLFLAGLEAMRVEYSGEYWIEVFLVAGVNDADPAVRRIAEMAHGIRPDRIHLNTAVRPPHDTRVRAVPEERMRELAQWFTPVAEVVTSGAGARPAATSPTGMEDLHGRLLQLIRRHPCTAEEAAVALDVEPSRVVDALDALVAGNEIRVEWQAGKPYYVGQGRNSGTV